MKSILFALLIPALILIGATKAENLTVNHVPFLSAAFKVKHHIPRLVSNLTEKELSGFTQNAYEGCLKDVRTFKWLGVICTQESNGDKRLQRKYGLLGGHWGAIRAGDRELGYHHKKRWIESHPGWKTKCLARRFKWLYDRNNSYEKTCRIWKSGGGGWRSPDAYKYWRDAKIQKANLENEAGF